MYLPPQFRCADPHVAARLMREHPLATLMSVDDEGLPFITHLPLHLEVEECGEADTRFTLLGHVAKPNPHSRFLRARPRARVSFMGPQGYLSPRVYPDLQRVPSWNYLAVTCVVEASFLDEDTPKDRLLKALIGDHEPAYADQWRALPEDFTHKMLQGIVAFELQVTEWQCKLKINQHRPESHQALHDAYAAGTEQERALARWMETLGMVPKA